MNLNGTDVIIKKLVMHDNTRDMALWDRYNFQSLYIEYIDNNKIITKYIDKSDINSSELYEFIIENNILKNFNIHIMLFCIVVCFILLFVILLILIVQHFYKVL